MEVGTAKIIKSRSALLHYLTERVILLFGRKAGSAYLPKTAPGAGCFACWKIDLDLVEGVPAEPI